MPTFVYMTRCDGCGHCVDICPSDIMHIDKTYRRAYNIEPNMCWECYSCVKACPQNAIDVRGYGGSDKPPRVEDYTLEKIAGDLVGLADALKLDLKVVAEVFSQTGANSRVLVTDGGRATVFRNAGDVGKPDLQAVKSYNQDNPPNRDQARDMPSRVMESVGFGRSTAEQPDYHQMTEDRFVKGIAADMAKELAAELRMSWNIDFDDSGAIGRRYRRQDEIGTPFCITVDFESLEDKAVTVRHRDTMAQERILIEDLHMYLALALKGA